MSRFKNGAKDYAIGNHPLWELFRAAYQTTKRPRLVGGLAVLAGYAGAAVRRVERPVSRELIKFYRREQMSRLARLLTGKPASKRAPLEHPPQCA